jgi:uncharacterized delta-60 repeat protein
MRSSILVGAFVLVLSCASVANAEPGGVLDSTFGQNGKVTTNISAVPTDVHVLADGRIDVVGGGGVVRFLSDGAFDASFGRSGAAAVGFNAVSEAIQSDGKVVVVGTVLNSYGSPINAAVARLNPKGKLDRTFGGNGVVNINFVNGAVSSGAVVILQPNGKIVVGGLARIGICQRIVDTGLARLNSNGSFDANFGYGGIVALQSVYSSTFNGLAMQSNGKILALGDNTTVLRFLTNGVRDSSITGGTIASIAHVGTGTFQPDGKVVVGANYYEDNGYDLDLQPQRYLRNGLADPTFNGPIIDYGGNYPPNDFVVDSPNAIAIDSTGRVDVGGMSQAPDYSSKFGLARFGTSGSLDATFGNGGTLTTPFLMTAEVTALAIQLDGKIIAVGASGSSKQYAPNWLVIARYLGP